jgi:hypothetical protein
MDPAAPAPLPPPSTGLPALDAMLKGVRPGDNIVWQIDSIREDYLPFVYPFIKHARQHHIPLIYFRFALYPELLSPNDCTRIYYLKPEEGFERFVNEILDVIDTYGRGAYYVFDCLSEIAVDWYSERMLGNFFMQVCPYLYQLETVAYFALLKNHHITDAITAIHTTAQVIVEVFRDKNRLYLQPFKVDGRHSPTMYMLHQWERNEFTPVISSAQVTEIMARVPQTWLDFTIQRIDVWPKMFLQAQQVLDEVQARKRPTQDAEYYFQRLLRMEITTDPNFKPLAEKYFDLEDLLHIRKRMIGTGLIGGKAVGMLLARTILKKSHQRWVNTQEEHDSFFIGSNVFYAFLVQNKCWDILRRQRNVPAFLPEADTARARIRAGVFSDYITNQFKEMLNYFGQSPIIVRSSSVLEDAFGNSFSGKYDSVFCANQGTPEERLEEFISAVRTVYASTISDEALHYREKRDLLNYPERMAILVQRVSGNVYGNLFFPHAAGVGFSFNPFIWHQDIEPQAGMLRLVFGLGTRAVDRRDDDYTRIVSLSAPLKRPESTLDQVRKYAQHHVDILDLKANKLATSTFAEIIRETGLTAVLDQFASRDPEIERMMLEPGQAHLFPWVLTFEQLLSRTDFMETIRGMLTTLQAAYNFPVDIEFTINFLEDGTYHINLLQCRPFPVQQESTAVELPAGIPEDKMFFRTQGPIIGNSLVTHVDRVVYVVPAEYDRLSQSDRFSLGRVIGRLTHTPDLTHRHRIMLIGPGRWGTTTPSLGVPVTFAEINTVSVLCEIVAMNADIIPDVSLGTHFFNDLVETGVLYLAIFPDQAESFIRDEFLLQAPNRLAALLPADTAWERVIRVVDLPVAGTKLHLHVNTLEQRAMCHVE